MTKKEFQEMVAINAALGNKYDAVLAKLRTTLDFEVAATDALSMEEDFPDKESLAEYIQKNIIDPVPKIFLSAPEIDERELDISVILKYWEDEANSPRYQKKIKVGIRYPKRRVLLIETPSRGFLLYLIAIFTKIKGPITFSEVCQKVKSAAKSFDETIVDYVTAIRAERKKWRKYYRKVDSFLTPRYVEIYNSIKDVYLNDYILTKNDFEEGIEKWKAAIQAEMKSIKAFDTKDSNPGLEGVPIEKVQFEKWLNKSFDDLGSEYPVYAELKANLFTFFKGFKGPLVLGAFAKYIEKEGGKIEVPKYDFDTYKSIKDDSAIYDELSKISLKRDVLLKSLDKTNPIYYNQDPVLSKSFEDFKASIEEAIKEWKNNIAEKIYAIKVVGLPEINNIKQDVKQGCIGYSKDICDQLIALIDKGFSDAAIYNSSKLLRNVKDILSSQKIVPKDTTVLAQEWWKKSEATLNANSNLVQKDLLPHPITIVNAFDRNILQGVSPQEFDRSMRRWRDDIRGAISLIAIDFPEGSTVVGKDLLEHLSSYFENPILKRLWTQMKTLLPKGGETVKIEGLQEKWLAAIADDNWDNTVLAAKADQNDGIGLLFLDFYEHYADKNKIQVFCDSAYSLLPSKEEIGLAIKNAIKKKAVVPGPRKINPIKQLGEQVSILDLKDQYFALRNNVLDGYRNIVNQTSNWLTSVENVSLAYVKAHKVYDQSVTSCKKSAQTQAEHANMILGTVFVGVGVVAGAFVAPLVATAGVVSVFGASMAAGPVAGFAGGTIGKAIGSNFMASAKKLTDNSQTEFEFYLELKQSFPKDIAKLKNEIEKIITGIDDKIQYLAENGPSGTKDLRNPSFNIEQEKKRLKEGTSAVNSFIKELNTAINVIQSQAIKLTPKVEAIDVFERNLYRIFIKNNFDINSYGGIRTKDWDVICGATFFRSRLIGFNLLTEDDFIDEIFTNSDGESDMKKLFQFANSKAEAYLQ
ncbi:hypothetical protein [Aureispira sp. CCB-E]|uniref:hypothetical protein n=1 Tax=Aureispira sp. CCB-E TaxID=3051121 RepID=UPI00286880A9|nr:hypothetical protein [Aureispira sp. CCB-E]WMX16531.1 hypothetical protein QP953_09145 [Aureispira sp. CCB-E]